VGGIDLEGVESVSVASWLGLPTFVVKSKGLVDGVVCDQEGLRLAWEAPAVTWPDNAIRARGLLALPDPDGVDLIRVASQTVSSER
jgi:hypothetical protein